MVSVRSIFSTLSLRMAEAALRPDPTLLNPSSMLRVTLRGVILLALLCAICFARR